MKQYLAILITLISTQAFSDSRHSIIDTIQAGERKLYGPGGQFWRLTDGTKLLQISFSNAQMKIKLKTTPDGRRYPKVQVPLIEGTYSGLPLGVISFTHRDISESQTSQERHVVAWTDFERCGVTAREVPEALRPNYGRWLEKINRLSLAKYAADKRIRAGSSQAVNGRSLAGFTAQKSNVNFVRFADWASARGIQYIYDSAKCTISFTRNGKSVLLPIAAKSVRVNGTWRDLPDIVMISPDRDERTLVPVALDALTN